MWTNWHKNFLRWLSPWLILGFMSWLPALTQAQSVQAKRQFVVEGVRPEAFSWLWDHWDEPLFKAATPRHAAFAWLTPPGSPEHLGYSAGARYRATVQLAGKPRLLEVSYLPYEQARGRVSSDNHLGSKPYSYLLQRVVVDNTHTLEVLAQYTPTGTTHGDTTVQLEARAAGLSAPLAQAYLDLLTEGLQGLSGQLMAALNTRYFQAVLQQRGRYTISPMDKQLNVTLTVEQDIKGITPDMLAWWWDHIGDTARYRLWQPIEHVSFEWTRAPQHPDMNYDIGARQRVKEYIGRLAMPLYITGADPAAEAPPVPTGDAPNYFYADTDLTWVSGILPSNKLVHRWRWNDNHDGVVLTSVFVNTALARALNVNFFDDLGKHALREFQMMPYFLPRLYRREQLGE